MSITHYQLQKLTLPEDRVQISNILCSMTNRIDNLESRIESLTEQVGQLSNGLENTDMSVFTKSLEQYVSINDMNSLIKDIEENLNSLMMTPRDISSIKDEIDKIKLKLESKSVDISQVEVIKDENSLTKSSSTTIPKITICKKKI